MFLNAVLQPWVIPARLTEINRRPQGLCDPSVKPWLSSLEQSDICYIFNTHFSIFFFLYMSNTKKKTSLLLVFFCDNFCDSSRLDNAAKRGNLQKMKMSFELCCKKNTFVHNSFHTWLYSYFYCQKSGLTNVIM